MHNNLNRILKKDLKVGDLIVGYNFLDEIAVKIEKITTRKVYYSYSDGMIESENKSESEYYKPTEKQILEYVTNKLKGI